jgi:hypothetical protein
MVVDATHALLSGSSMSSPQVAGAVALLLEKDATLTQPQILRLLQQGARRPTGVVSGDYGLGAGALDVVGTMAAADARASSIVREPHPAASWLSLASNTLHPAGDTPPVTGWVMVRGADGSLADGFDEQRLALVVSKEGIVVEPLSRVAAGLYRFALQGATGMGSRLVELDVRLDGTSIGQSDSRLYGRRFLPVGADRWIAAGSARVYGGCSVAPSAQGRGVLDDSPAGALAFAAALSLKAARRRWSRHSRGARREIDRDRRGRRGPDHLR